MAMKSDNNLRVLYFGWQDPMHSKAGGYGQIVHFPGADWKDPSRFIDIYHDENRGGIIKRLKMELFTLSQIRESRHYDVFHNFYGDVRLYSMKFFPKRHCKLVHTVHLDFMDPRGGRKEEWLNLIRKADGILTVSSRQAKIAKEMYGLNAHYIPHGFNQPHFHQMMPIGIDNHWEDDKVNIFIAGKNYRDNATIINTVKHCQKNHANIAFHIIGVADWVKKELGMYHNAVIYPRLTDDEYFTILSKCDYNFLPVTFASANNTLLEGQYLGITGIFPAIEGIEDYASPQNLFYNDFEDLIQKIITLEKRTPNPALQQYSQQFNWENTFQLLDKYYRCL